MIITVKLLLGVTLLVGGAYFLVEGASGIARRLRVGSLTIGLTIVALGTSAPELAVNSVAAARGFADIGIANVIGSNIFNVLAALGIASLVSHLTVRSTTVRYEIPMCLASAVLLLVLIDSGMLTRVDAVLLLALFAAFLVYTALTGRASGSELVPDTSDDRPELSLPRALLYFVSGCGAVILGGEWVVNAAVVLAEQLGVSQRVIGLTIVAVGTSLPEAATSVVAVFRGETDIAVGNAVGSSLSNVLLVLGVTAAISPVSMGPGAFHDGLMYLAGATLLFAFALLPSPGRIHRIEGSVMLLAYAAYIWYTVAVG